jgi:tRNA (guanine-N7-)-methyltransferase
MKICSRDACDVLEEQIDNQSLERINIYFPDPWPKKRHHKRRLIQKDFLDLCASKLKKNGQLHIATDWNNYAEHITEIIEKNTNFLVNTHVKHNGKIKLDRPATKFEKKGLYKGHSIWDWVLTKIS